MKTIRIGLAGAGIVGGGVIKHLDRQRALLQERTGFNFELRRVAALDPQQPLSQGVPSDRITTNAMTLAEDPELDIVVELMGGISPARELIGNALKAGKGVVTANKALLAETRGGLIEIARQSRKPFCFEASVAGGIPILKALREGLVANRILSIHGIVNGTCNFILSQIAQNGAPYAEVLAEAQRLGFAEANPTLDVEGFDTMHKACVLAALAYGTWPDPKQIAVRGISGLDPSDFSYAHLLGYTIKLLAVTRSTPSGCTVELHVQPTLVPQKHVLASVSGSFNALLVRGDVVGDTLYYGRGAGADPTASAVIADLVDAAQHLTHGSMPPCCSAPATNPPTLTPFAETTSRYYLRLSVMDRPGTLASIASVLGQHDIGILSVFQPKDHVGENVPLVMLLHNALEKNLRTALSEISALTTVFGQPVALRVEDFE
jgi:homoserine dehydrogenase